MGTDLSHLGAVLSVAKPAWGYDVAPHAIPDARIVLRKLEWSANAKSVLGNLRKTSCVESTIPMYRNFEIPIHKPLVLLA
ncbi:hypothetical protein ALP22_200040 [Pseudomonas coronafaciens pv. porri]|nr:hypothetical protein ALP22_200040 [Pseudomonas coronafaciens pv. porri]